jgi:hypothetical protein
MKRASRRVAFPLLAWVVDYARYVLVLPTVLAWFIAVVVVIEMTNVWFLEVLLAPVGLLALAFSQLDPGFDGALRIGYGSERDQIPWGFLGTVYFMTAALFWAVRARWRKFRKAPPPDPRFLGRLSFMAKAAALVSAVAFVALRFRVSGDGGGEIFLAIFLWFGLAFTGTWAVLVETVADRLVARISGGEAAGVGSVSGGVAAPPGS